MGTDSQILLFPFAIKQLTVSGLSLGPRSALEAMLRFLEKWQLRPMIDGAYEFSDTLEAYRHLYRGAFGKVVVHIAEQ